IVIFIISIIVFILFENKVKNPLIDFKLFKHKAYSGATVSNFLLNAVAGTLIVANTYFQSGLHFTSFQSGMMTITYLVAVLIVIFIISIIVFILFENKVKNPLIDFKLFKHKAYSGATVSNFLLNAVAGTLIVANTYFQSGLHFTSFQSGMMTITYLVAVLIM